MTIELALLGSRGRRQNFTLAHELAHFLVYEDEDALEWLLSQSETGRLTEALCDAIASRLLIPDEVLKAVGSTPSGLVLVDLRDRTIASDNACAIRVAGRLPCAGFVAVIDVDDQAVACASRRDGTRPYAWKGNPLPDGHPLARVADGQTLAVESWWPFPDGTRSMYYLNARREGGRIYAVFAEEDLWRVTNFHPTREVHDERRPEHALRCPCGYRGVFHAYPCGDCGKPHCPKCGRCDCTRRAERDRRCRGCTLMFAPQLLDDADHCEDCR